MRPLRLEMEGFGAFHARTEIDFADIELVALVGDTGSGKTTIIDAITFALYGSVARYDDDRLVAPVINQTSTSARVRLDFELAGRRYTAVRLVQRTKTGAQTKEARLELDDDVLADDPKSMSNEVAALLGLDAPQFNRTVVLPQGRFADFLHDKPRHRQDTLRQLLGFDVYERLGKEARARAAFAKSQIAALQADLDDVADDLTDDRRIALDAGIEAVVMARARFAADCEEVDALRVELAEQRAAAEAMVAPLALLDSIAAPEGVAELDVRRRESSERLGDARAVADAARQRLRAATAAAHNGPDLARCKADLQRLHQAMALHEQHHAAALALDVAVGMAEAVAAKAAAVEIEQRRLVDALAEAREAEAAARSIVEAGPDPTRVGHWATQRERRATLVAELVQLRERDVAALASAGPLEARAEQAEAAVAAAEVARDDAKGRAGVAGYASLLSVGTPCPLCLQEVHALPEHHADEVVEFAERALAEARDARQVAVVERDAARVVHARSSAAVSAADAQLGQVDADLEGVAPADELSEMLADAARRRSMLDAASAAARAAEHAETAHRTDAGNAAAVAAAVGARDEVTARQAAADTLGRQVAAARADVAGLPAEQQLVEQIVAAEGLAAAVRAANDEVDRGDAAFRDVEAASIAIAGEIESARAVLAQARDRLAVLDPPGVSGDDFAGGWQVLAAWSVKERALRVAAGEQADAAVRATRTRLEALEGAARTRCAPAFGDPGLDLGHFSDLRIRELLASQESARRAELKSFDERRQRIELQRVRIRLLQDEADVATTLGHLLRADGFEGWLMQAALDELVDAATVRLRELSGGQFSLELVDREFMVRDHTNADELRSARTLSGGETFLASLSLALALADATASLAPEGAPGIESIFLDEGFGTLDPTTLDIVAAAIEELGARGRMVGIVTHIRDLAERMPVRLEVTKVAGASTVQRIEA